jgi:divalent metal cation (Fe/Co/Zn/Cd) transporter
VARLAGWIEIETSTDWWVFAAVGLVIVIDVTRTAASWSAARTYSSPALASNALHFGSDLAGTLAVLAGLVAVHAGWAAGDSLAALFVAFLVVSAAARLIRRNVDVLMDRAPADAVLAASAAIATLDPPVEVRRLRLRQAAGRTFTDVVIGVSPGAAVGQGHAVADRVEEAVHGVLPDSDVVVHVEPAREESALRERVHEAAVSVARVREIHNLTVLELPDGFHVSLHLKLPGELALEDAHELAEQVERAIVEGVPEIVDVQTHLEPLAETTAGSETDADPRAIRALVLETTGVPPRAVRFLDTDEGLVILLTLALDPAATLAAAHATASSVEERIRETVPGVTEVIVHTEP